jgi:hypothetical protein
MSGVAAQVAVTLADRLQPMMADRHRCGIQETPSPTRRRCSHLGPRAERVNVPARSPTRGFLDDIACTEHHHRVGAAGAGNATPIKEKRMAVSRIDVVDHWLQDLFDADVVHSIVARS